MENKHIDVRVWRVNEFNYIYLDVQQYNPFLWIGITILTFLSEWITEQYLFIFQTSSKRAVETTDVTKSFGWDSSEGIDLWTIFTWLQTTV